MKKIRVLVVDDSSLSRDIISSVLDSGGDIEIAGHAENGEAAVRMAGECSPDLILMDVHMPVMDGITATKRIMETDPVPIIIVTGDDSRATAFSALSVGALEVVNKPVLNDDEKGLAVRMFLESVRSLAAIDRARLRRQPAVEAAPATPRIRAAVQSYYEVLGIAASTGGPKALAEILPRIDHIDVPVLVTQHMNRDFAEGLINWLQGTVRKKIKFASQGEVPDRGHVYFAAPDMHLGITAQRKLALLDHPRRNYQKPSADFMFEAMAAAYGPAACGVILTGMGHDGADGLLGLKKSGGYTIAQDRESSIVFGMPGAALEAGAVAQKDVLPLGRIPDRIAELFHVS